MSSGEFSRFAKGFLATVALCASGGVGVGVALVAPLTGFDNADGGIATGFAFVVVERVVLGFIDMFTAYEIANFSTSCE